MGRKEKTKTNLLLLSPPRRRPRPRAASPRPAAPTPPAPAGAKVPGPVAALAVGVGHQVPLLDRPATVSVGGKASSLSSSSSSSLLLLLTTLPSDALAPPAGRRVLLGRRVPQPHPPRRVRERPGDQLVEVVVEQARRVPAKVAGDRDHDGSAPSAGALGDLADVGGDVGEALLPAGLGGLRGGGGGNGRRRRRRRSVVSRRAGCSSDGISISTVSTQPPPSGVHLQVLELHGDVVLPPVEGVAPKLRLLRHRAPPRGGVPQKLELPLRRAVQPVLGVDPAKVDRAHPHGAQQRRVRLRVAEGVDLPPDCGRGAHP